MATLATRRLLLTPQDVEGGTAAQSSDNEDEMDLPSYSSHVRDRVANAYLPEQGMMRVANPWIVQGVSPVIHASGQSSGMTSPVPLEAHPLGTHSEPLTASQQQLPQVPSPDSLPLDWVNSELLLSLTQNPETPAHLVNGNGSRMTPPTRTPPEPTTANTSRFPSRLHSRANSRASSPERRSRDRRTNGHHDHEHHFPGETYVHGSTASRHLHGLFHMSMKPFGTFTSNFGLGSRSNSRTDLQHHLPHGHSHLSNSSTSLPSENAETRHRSGSASGSASPSPSSSAVASPSSSSLHITPLSMTARPITADPITGPMLLHRAFTQTPDYEVASRGFLGGGVPPLDSFRGLPSYEEAAREVENASNAASLPRSRSVPDIAGPGLGSRMTMTVGGSQTRSQTMNVS